MLTTKGERALIQVAGSPIDVFMLPSGDYRYSLSSASAAINKEAQDFDKYLRRSNPEAGEGALLVSVGRTRVKGLTESAVVQYWTWKADNGNNEAKALLAALAAEALTRRADAAFGNTKTEQQYEEQTTQLRVALLSRLIEGWVPFVRDRNNPREFNYAPYPVMNDASPEEEEALDLICYVIACEPRPGSPTWEAVDARFRGYRERLRELGVEVVNDTPELDDRLKKRHRVVAAA